MKFNNALGFMEINKKVKRKGWNGKDQYVTVGEIILAKDCTGQFCPDHKDIGNKVLIFHGSSGTQIWTPSNSDLLSDDWEVV